MEASTASTFFRPRIDDGVRQICLTNILARPWVNGSIFFAVEALSDDSATEPFQRERHQTPVLDEVIDVERSIGIGISSAWWPSEVSFAHRGECRLRIVVEQLPGQRFDEHRHPQPLVGRASTRPMGGIPRPAKRRSMSA